MTINSKQKQGIIYVTGYAESDIWLFFNVQSGTIL